jgi:hypothetical protein
MAAKKSKKSAKPVARKATAKPAAKKAAPAKPRGPEISSDLRKVALAHALRRLK